METILTALKAAAEPTRLRLLALLADAELTVTELTQILGQSQPRVSRHLKLMVEAGLIDRFREGSWAYYRLTDDGAGAGLSQALLPLLPDDDTELRRDHTRLQAVLEERAGRAQDYFRANAAKWDELRKLHIPEAVVEQAMLAAAGPTQDLLDLGTGTGRILEVFADRIERGVGIDLSAEMLAIARANLDQMDARHIQVRRGDLYALPVDDASIDLVTVHMVLHFLDAPATAISEAARVLRPGGQLQLVDFAPHNLEFLREEQAHHRLGFADEEVNAACRAAGLMPRPVQHFAPPADGSANQLTVSLWVADKPAYPSEERISA